MSAQFAFNYRIVYILKIAMVYWLYIFTYSISKLQIIFWGFLVNLFPVKLCDNFESYLFAMSDYT